MGMAAVRTDSRTILFDQNAVSVCFERGKALGHDTIMVKIESQGIEDRHNTLDLNFRLLLSLFAGRELIDERTVTVESRGRILRTRRTDVLDRGQDGLDIRLAAVRQHMAVARYSGRITVPDQAKRPERDASGGRNGAGLCMGQFECSPEAFYEIDKKTQHYDQGPDLALLSGIRVPARPSLFRRKLLANYNRPEAMVSDMTRRSIRSSIRDMAFNHVLLHWGLLDYDRIVFKAPNEGNAANIIMDALPRARMIFLVRDGRDILKSRFSPFASRTLAETQDAGLRRVAIAYYAHQWNWNIDIVRGAYYAHPAELKLLLTYEELRGESQEAFRRVLEFVGARLDDAAIRKLIERVRLENFPESERARHLPRQEGKIGAYKLVFTPEEQRLMTTIMADNLRRFHYDVSAAQQRTLREAG